MKNGLVIFFVGFVLLIAQSWAGARLEKTEFAKKHEKLVLAAHLALMAIFLITMIVGLVIIFRAEWWVAIGLIIFVIPVLAQFMQG